MAESGARRGQHARHRGRRILPGAAVALVLLATTAACGGTTQKGPEVAKGGPSGTTTTSDVAMKDPAPLKKSLLSPDLLVTSQQPLPQSVIGRIRAVKGVADTELFSTAQFFYEERAIRYAAVNPAAFRRYLPSETAFTTRLWKRVADGEIMIRPDLGRDAPTEGDYLQLGSGANAPRIHIGALAPLNSPVTAPYLDAVLNERWAARLKMPAHNAMLVSTGATSPQLLRKTIAGLAGPRTSVQILGPDVDPNVAQQAVLTGTPFARAVGSFSYTVNRNGTVNPDAGWVHQFIRTEEVPILGKVTCNKVMLIQLRAALRDVIAAHLAASIHPGEYGGCYVPRFIGRDPAQGLSFHTWGTAIDLNVPGNQRGTVGTMDRRVVQIMARWGFNWGGLWRYTDPMHFELARIVKVG